MLARIVSLVGLTSAVPAQYDRAIPE